MKILHRLIGVFDPCKACVLDKFPRAYVVWEVDAYDVWVPDYFKTGEVRNRLIGSGRTKRDAWGWAYLWLGTEKQP